MLSQGLVDAIDYSLKSVHVHAPLLCTMFGRSGRPTFFSRHRAAVLPQDVLLLPQGAPSADHDVAELEDDGGGPACSVQEVTDALAELLASQTHLDVLFPDTACLSAV